MFSNGLYTDLLNHLFDLHPFLKNISFSQDSQVVRLTKEAIILEGLYKSSSSDEYSQNTCLLLRANRWSKNCGVPSVEFLLTYANIIEEIQNSLHEKTEFHYLNDMTVFKPSFTYDTVNQVLFDPEIFSTVSLPEETNGFIPTHNPVGGFTTRDPDPFSQEFIDYSIVCAKNGYPVLDIATGFGVATLPALKKGASVICNDISPKNLAVVHQLYQQQETSKSGRLKLFSAMFPNEFMEIPHGTIGAILICRLLHFFTGEKIIEALNVAKNLLIPGGKIFIVAETPYLKNWQSFIPEYKKRCVNGLTWPGEIKDSSQYETEGYIKKLPSFMHLLDKKILIDALKTVGFSIEKAEYVDRHGIFPDGLILSGKESIGIIGVN